MQRERKVLLMGDGESWKLTQNALGEPEIDAWGGEAPLSRWMSFPSLLEELARDPANGLERLADGWYSVTKLPGDSAR